MGDTATMTHGFSVFEAARLSGCLDRLTPPLAGGQSRHYRRGWHPTGLDLTRTAGRARPRGGSRFGGHLRRGCQRKCRRPVPRLPLRCHAAWCVQVHDPTCRSGVTYSGRCVPRLGRLDCACPKHVHDAATLGVTLSRAVPRVAPQSVAPNIYGSDADSSCHGCAISRHPAWPLAPKDRIFEWPHAPNDRIFELLGWQRQPNPALPPTARPCWAGGQ